MSRPIPVGHCNHRFDEETPSSEAIADAACGARRRVASDQADAIGGDDSLDCPSEPLELSKLDEASVDACFSRLSDLLADID